jgi:hypothetical protein
MPQSKQAFLGTGVLPQAGEAKLVLFGGGYENVNYNLLIKDAELNIRCLRQRGEFTVSTVGMQAKVASLCIGCNGLQLT